MRRSFAWWEAALAAGVLVVLVVALLLPALTKPRSGGHPNRCSSNLRQLALAAVSYAGDRRFFPHVGGLRELDGDWTTPDAPRAMVALVYFGYLDDPATFVCRSSADLAAPLGDAQRDDRHLWTFGPTGAQNPRPDVSPLTSGVPLTGSLLNSTQLSYGWTRKPMNNNASGATLLGADRSIRLPSAVTPAPPGTLGNHPDGWNVVHVDASVEFLSARYDRGDGVEPFDYLGATGDANRDGFLAMEWAGANPLGKTP